MELKIRGLDDLQMNMLNYGKYNNTAVRSSMNRVGITARKEALNQTSKIQGWNLAITKFKAVSKTKSATNSDLHLQFIMNSKSIPLIDFKGTDYQPSTTPKGRKRKGGAGVRFKLKKQNGKKVLAKSFIAPSLFGGKETVFVKRKSPRGASITAQSSITPSSMFKQEGEDKYISVFFRDFEARYYNQLRYYKIL